MSETPSDARDFDRVVMESIARLTAEHVEHVMTRGQRTRNNDIADSATSDMKYTT